MLKNCCLIFLFSSLLSPLILSGQVAQPKRAEIPLERGDDYFLVVSAEDNGLILIREAERKPKENLKGWQILLLNTSLNRDWEKEVYISDEFSFIGYDYSDGFFYILFENNDFSDQKYMIVKLDLESQEQIHYEINKIFDIELSDFIIEEGIAVFEGSYNLKPVIFIYDFVESRPKVLPGVYSSLNEIVSMKIDPSTKTLTVVMNELTLRKRITFVVKTYSLDSRLLRTVKLEPDGDYSLLDGEVSSFEKDRVWVSGTYAKGRSRFSRGMFIAQISNRGQENITFINYGDFKNFFKYMRKRRETRVQNRIQRRKEKGKTLKFNYRVKVHEIVERDDEYIMVGEAYYPRYNNPGYYGGLSYTYRSRFSDNIYFDGFRYTHAVVVGFDKNGKMLWDNSFEINDVISFTLDQFVHINADPDKIVLLYSHEGSIKSKIIQDDEVIDGKSETEIATRFESDEVKDIDDDFGELNYWYDDYFYVYGVQNIKNLEEGSVDLTRRVFFINKVEYQHN